MSRLTAQDNVWYLGKTKPRQEARAKLNLERQGFETYLPMIYVDKRTGKRQDAEPMFCGYIFIRSDSLDFQRVRSTIGMQKLVRFGEVPAQISGRHITQLKAREDKDGLHGSEMHFQAGDSIRITEGPFRDYPAIVWSNRKGRIKVLLGNLAPFEIEERYLKAS